MDHKSGPLLHPGVARKADAVAKAISAGYRDIGAIASTTHLSETTVIRVAAMLRGRGLVALRPDGLVLVPPPRA